MEQVLRNADIVDVISHYLNVIKKGRSYVAICPFHEDSNPSLNISQEKQIFKCFVCNTGGNAITFVMKKEGISFEEAVRKVAELSNFHDDRLEKEASRKERRDPSLTPLIQCIDDLQKYYVYGLSIPEGEAAREYLKTRNIPAEQIAKYGIGYSPADGRMTVKFLQGKGHSLKSIEDIGIALARANDATSDHNAGRLIFPLFDPNGQVVGFSARRLQKDDSSKYINSPDGKLFHKGNLLYNYHNVRSTAKRDGYCYLLEGFMDVMALERASLPNAVALMGTSLTKEQIALLKRLNCEIRLCLDGDDAGQRAMMKILPQLQKADIPFRVVSNPGDLRDPDDILQEEGPEALKAKMGNLVTAYDFQIDYYTNTKKLDTQDDRRKVMMYFIPFLRNVKAGIDRDNYVIKLAKATGYEPETIYRQIQVAQKGELTQEEQIYQDQRTAEFLNVGTILSNRLVNAERQVLYYMLTQVRAVNFYQQEIDSFYNSIYETLANFIIEYLKRKGESKVDVSQLVNDIAASGNENLDELESSLSTIAMDDWWPSFSDDQLRLCKKTIQDEK
ncbi:MAG: DNA primase, partial [Bacilli bacterium]|nr:DNA primase [Bacilli bacterium]